MTGGALADTKEVTFYFKKKSEHKRVDPKGLNRLVEVKAVMEGPFEQQPP